MHLTVSDGDSKDDLKRRLARGDAKILLDGNEVTFVIEAHEEKEFVVQYEVDADGRFVLDRSTGEVKTVTRFGKVEIIDIKREPEL